MSAIIDGETVLLDDGKEVRLVGALAPRSSDAARGKHAAALDWPPEAAARAALAELVAGRSVALAFAGRRVDRYGRLLAQVFLKGNTGDVWVQGRMIALGHARAYALPETDSCLTDLLKLEAPARRERRGLWGHAAYQIRPADRPRELARYAATFQLMRGVVERAGRSRRGTYLELASSEPPRPGDAARNKGLFRVILPHEAKAGRRPAKTDDLVSRSVLVRGWVETRSGPQVALSERAELEIDE